MTMTKEQTAALTAARLARTPLAIVGYGPWRVSGDCPAPRHNTLIAARGRVNGNTERVVPEMKCVCPRARALMAAYYVTEAARKRGDLPRPVAAAKKAIAAAKPRSQRTSRRNAGTAGSTDRSDYVINTRGQISPESLTKGSCVIDPQARMVMDRGKVEAKRAVCVACPVRAACLGWALGNELPAPGAWDGMYGGLTQAERRKYGTVAA